MYCTGTAHAHRVPQKLPGTVWGITAFFNPCGYATYLENYRVFRKKSAGQGLRLVAVELVFGEQQFVLQSGDADILVQIRGGDVLWQKERLLNVALRHLPSDCDKVVILDTDVLFERDDWLAQVKEKLEEYMVVFPFSHLIRLPKGLQQHTGQRCRFGFGEDEMCHSFGFGFSRYGMAGTRLFRKHGVTGGAVAVRRWLLDKHGLYDADITGAGDVIFAQACVGNTNYMRLKRMSRKQKEHARQWSYCMAKDVRQSIGYVDGVALHLWHGTQANRRYSQRHEMLYTENFDPLKDISLHRSGAWQWASPKEQLHRACREYFSSRRDDVYT